MRALVAAHHIAARHIAARHIAAHHIAARHGRPASEARPTCHCEERSDEAIPLTWCTYDAGADPGKIAS